MTTREMTVEEGVTAFLPDLTRFAHHLVGPRYRQEAEDLVQKSIVRALERKDQFQVGTNLAAWLFTIMRSLFISERRHAKVRRIYEERAALGPSTSTPPNQFQIVLLRETLTTITNMADRDVEYIRDLALSEQPQADAAESEGVPVGTIKSRLSRSRAKLRAMMQMDKASLSELDAA